MNTKIEVLDKTVEGAIEKGLEQLGVKKENAEIEVIAEPGTGFLGLLGSKAAKVTLSVKQEPKEYIKQLLGNILDKIGVNGEINIEENDEEFLINVSGKNLGILIGRRGQNLNSLQYLTNIIMRRQFEKFNGRVIIDAENYRQERERSLVQLAMNMAYKAEKQNQPINMEPMTPQERRIIHITLKDNPGIRTYSVGDEPHRKVVIAPAE